MSRPNAELARKYWADPTLKAWWWDHTNRMWHPDAAPSFVGGPPWHIGHEAPTEPPIKMCEMAGIKFPRPMTEKPEHGTRYWWAAADGTRSDVWVGNQFDKIVLTACFCQATEAGAIAQSKAMRAALKAAIEEAK